MKIFSAIAVLSLASTARSHEDIRNNLRGIHQGDIVPHQARSLATNYTYNSDLECQPSFCVDFSTKCEITAGANGGARPDFTSTCNVTLDAGVELKCTEACVDPSANSTNTTSATQLPTRAFQIIDTSEGTSYYCLEVETDDATGQPMQGGNVLRKLCDGNPAQQWTLQTGDLSEFFISQTSRYFTVRPNLDSGLCIDMMERLPDARKVRVYDCIDFNSFNQHFDIDFFDLTNGKLLTAEEKCVKVGHRASVFGSDLTKTECADTDRIPTFSFLESPDV